MSDRRLVFANAAARELLRIQSEGGPLVSAIRDPEVLEAVDEALFGGLTARRPTRPAAPRTAFWRVRARPLAPAADGARLALLVFRDETEVRRDERTRADFLANASHELRTPLASLSGFIETLRGHARDDAGARERFLGIMQAQAERMARLIDDLMSLSRIELERAHRRPRARWTWPLVALDVVDAAGARWPPSAACSCDCAWPSAAGPLVAGDRDQIVQVVQNLVDNALKYSPAAAWCEIEVAERPDRRRGRWRRARHGAAAPVAAEPRPRRRRALRRSCASPTTAPASRASTCRGSPSASIGSRARRAASGSGTGLGLAIVKHIINRHRGGLVVESAEGEGTTFTAYFPLAGATGGCRQSVMQSCQQSTGTQGACERCLQRVAGAFDVRRVG